MFKTSISRMAILRNIYRDVPRVLLRKYRVMREERSVLYEVIVSVIGRKSCYEIVFNFGELFIGFLQSVTHCSFLSIRYLFMGLDKS
jgi:hypothetical protein